MKIDCKLIPTPIPREQKDAVFGVIDVLRATSTIVTAFMNGCQSIIPVARTEEAFDLARGPMAGALIGGEREGRAVEGFDLGNSPREYAPLRVQGQTIVLTTTNGTRTFRDLPEAATGIVASFLNLSAVARYCLRNQRDVVFVLSGRDRGFSLEDAVCAGGLVRTIWKRAGDRTELTDTARACCILYEHSRGNLVEMLRTTVHGRYLIEIGFEDDLEYCAQVDVTPIVPIYQNGTIKRSPSQR